MMSFTRRWIVAVLLMALAMPVHAASRFTVVTEIEREGKNPLSEVALITLDGDRGRIDIVERNGKKEKDGLYLMTLDGGKTAVLGNRETSVCSEWDSQEFFKAMGRLLNKVRLWTNLDITDVKIEKVSENPGPDVLGYSTTHLQLFTTARVKGNILLKKFRYILEITDDIWMAPQLGLHPIERAWINAQTNTGFKILDHIMDSWNKQIPFTMLKQESVFKMKDLEKKEESTKIEKIEVKLIEELNSSEIPEETFRILNCKKVSQSKMQASAKKMAGEMLINMKK